MENLPLLSVVTFLPLAGALFIFMTRSADPEVVADNSRYMALMTSHKPKSVPCGTVVTICSIACCT